MDNKRKQSLCLIFTIILCLSVEPVTSFAVEDVQPAAEEENANNNIDNIDGNNNGSDNDVLNPGDEDGSDEPVIESKSTEAGDGTEDSDASGDTNDGSGDDSDQNIEGGAENNNPEGATGEGEEKNGNNGDTDDVSGYEQYDEQSGNGGPGNGQGAESDEGAESGQETENGQSERDGTGEQQGTETGSSMDSSVPNNPYHTHQYIPVVTEPTCTEKGYTTYTCSCGDSYVDDYTDPLGHRKVVDVPWVPATVNSNGTTAGKKCEVCGEILEGCEEIPALTEESREFDKSVITGFEIPEPKDIREEVKPILDELNKQLHPEITIFLGGTLRYKVGYGGEPDDASRFGNTDNKTDNIDNTDNTDEKDGANKTGSADSNDKADNTDKTDKSEEENKSEDEDAPGSIIPGKPEGADKKTIPVTWTCVQNYDEGLPVFEFIPELEDYTLAPGISLPIQKVYIENEDFGPIGGHLPTGTGGDVPFAVSLRKSSPSIKYNPFEERELPPVRDQGSEGACWAFAAIGSIETDLIKGGWDKDEIDLSELYLAYYATHQHSDPKGCNTGDSITYRGSGSYLSNGGNNYMSYRTMANMVGPVAESTAPYPDGSPNGPNVAQMTGAYLYNPQDVNGIKAAILAHGGVDAGIYAAGNFFSYNYNSYYCPSLRVANHEVMLVGWDDSFPATHFGLYEPEGDGAWLVRNSWGLNGYGFSGYFWMSYFDQGFIGDAVTVYDAVSARYDSCYAYDSMPYPEAKFYLSRGQEVSQSFTLKGAEVIKAVGFETGGSNVSATIRVSNGQLVSTAHAYVGNMGFYLAELDTPLSGSAGQRITVTVSFSGDSSILYEDGRYTVQCGDTIYRSSCGGGGFTVDGYTYGYDASIKLFTDNAGSGGTVPVSGISLNTTLLNMPCGDHEQLYATIEPQNASGTFSWSSTNTNIVKVDQGMVIAVAPGSAKVAVTSNNGVSAECQVNVSPVSVRGISIQGGNSATKELLIDDSVPGFVVPSDIPLTLEYRTNPLNATNQSAEWNSSNPAVITLKTVTDSITGRIKASFYAKDAGSSVITVTSQDGGFTDTVTIRVAKTMYTLIYNANGGSGAPVSQRYSKGAEIKLQSGKPTRSGYTFKGWATTSNATTAQYQPGASYKLNNNATLYAVWARIYTLSYNANGGSGAPSSQSAVAGSTVKIPSGKPTRSGYSFKGWATTSNATAAQYQPGASYKLNNNATLYAVWARIYILTFNANGGSGAPLSQSTVAGSTVKLPSGKPTRSGYTFKGWATTNNATIARYQPGASYKPTNNTTFYAVWDYAPTIEGYVRRCYRVILGREGEQTGVDSWVSVLSSGAGAGASIVSGFMGSREFISKNYNNDQIITILYRSMLGREPDSIGKRDWLGVFDSGLSLNYVIAGFAGSQEFNGICASYGIQAGTVPLTENRDQNPKITQFITRNYNHALNRNGDVQGLNDWTDVLLQREATPKEVSFGFIFSPECLAKNLSNSDFVYMLYHLYMGRDPDPQGLSDWVRALDEGYSREHVANGFADSPEFQAIVRSYGL